MKKWYMLFVFLGSCFAFSISPAIAADDAAAPNEWPSYIEGLSKLGDLNSLSSAPQDPQLRHEFYQFMMSTITQAYFGTVYADLNHPDFYPAFDSAFAHFGTNPDNVYYLAPLDDKGSYRISGYRGTVHIIDFNLGSGMMLARGYGKLAKTLADYDIDTLHIDKKTGWFSVIVSPERPKDYKGDWWQMMPGTTNVLVRQLSYDMLKEVDGRFGIDRLDKPAIKPRKTPEEIADNLKQVAIWAENWTKFSFEWEKKLADQGYVNKVLVRNINDTGGFSTQTYIEGVFDLNPDEALIFETEIPTKCRYWNIELTDERFVAIDWVNRQSTLNGRSAKLDRDGKFRAVIAATDPGVANWLDTGGQKRGEMIGRWNTCNSGPVPTVTKVALADVKKHLPADTKMITPEARDESLRKRRLGAQLRRRW